MGIIVAFILGSLVTMFMGFFVWRNNKKKFMETMINIEGLIDRNDTREEIEAKLDKVFAELRSSFLAKAKEKLNKL